MNAISFQDVSKQYKLYSRGGLYLRDRITYALQRLNPFNGTQQPALSTHYSLERDFLALKNVSFDIKQGESVCFIGRNGAGKSTILKLLAGVTKPSSGKVEVTGKVAALIEVGAGFHPELTGRENIYLNGSILGLKKAEIEKHFDSIVSFAELEEFIDTPVKHYSSGMYVRLGFAIAVHTNPDIFLIDEVLAVGDEAFQQKCLDTLAAHKAAGKTMILVTHALDKAAEVCGRCIYVNHGEIGYDGQSKPAIEKYRFDLKYGGKSNNSSTSFIKTADHSSPQYSCDFVKIATGQRDLRDGITRRGNGAITFVSAAMRGSNDQTSDIFDYGEPINVELAIQSQIDIEKPIVGFSFVAEDGTEVLGTTAHDGIPLLMIAQGFTNLKCLVSPNILMPGKYILRAAVFSSDVVFDYIENIMSIEVRSESYTPDYPMASSHRVGYVYVPYRWSCERSV